MFDNANTLMGMGNQPSGQMHMAGHQSADPSASPFANIGSMTVQQAMDAAHSGGPAVMGGGFRNALMGLMQPQGGGGMMGMLHGMKQLWGSPAGGQVGGQGPVMTPGGGMGGGPPQGVGMVPGVPGSMGTNPGMGGPIQGQQPPTYQLPTY